MQSIQKEINEAKTEIYLILAEFFKNPDKDFYLQISNGSVEERLKELYIIVNYSHPNTPSLKDRFIDYSNFVNCYTRCISGLVNPCAIPVESYYKTWTADPSSDMYNLKGYIFGDSALHIKYLFEHYKLEIPKEYHSIPDHLTLLLEFLVFLIKFRTSTETKQFIIDHFNWLDDFKKELSIVTDSSFYLDITDLIINATQSELLYLQEIKE